MVHLPIEVLANVLERLSFKDAVKNRLVGKGFNAAWKIAVRKHITGPCLHSKDTITRILQWFIMTLENGIVGTPAQQLWMLEAVLRDGFQYGDARRILHWIQLMKTHFQLVTPMYNICIRVMQDKSRRGQHKRQLWCAEFIKYLYDQGVELPLFLTSELVERDGKETIGCFSKMDWLEVIRAAKQGNASRIHQLLQNPSKLKMFMSVKKAINRNVYDVLAEGELDKIDDLLALCPGIDINDYWSEYILRVCETPVSPKQIDVVEALLRHPELDVNSRQCKVFPRKSFYSTALQYAAESNRWAILDLLLERPELNITKNDESKTLMFACAEPNRIDVVERILLHPDMDAESASNLSRIIFFDACVHGNLGLVQMMVKYENIDVNSAYSNGQTALMIAVRHGHMDIVKYLLSLPGIDVNKADNKSDNPLTEAAAHQRREIVELLLNGPDIQLEKYGIEALVTACYKGNFEIVKRLLQCNQIDVNEADKTGSTPLMWASDFKRSRIILKLLLQHPQIDVTRKDEDGRTALHMACMKGGNLKVVKSLLRKSDSVINDARFDNGLTALMCAIQNRQINVVRYLMHHPKFDFNDSFNGENPFMLSSQHGCFAAIEILVEKGFEWDINQAEQDGKTALMWAAQEDFNGKVMDYLLNRPEIDINAASKVDGQTALMVAASFCGRLEAVESLLQHPDLDVNKADMNGMTALMFAADHECRSGMNILQTLLEHPVLDVNLKNNLQQSAVDLAANDEVVDMLLMHPGFIPN